VLLSREDVVRLGPKRPPLAAGVRLDGTGMVHVARTPGVVDAIRAIAPGFEVHELDVAGPPTHIDVRGAGWVEAAVLMSVVAARNAVVARAGDPANDLPASAVVRAPNGAEARAVVRDDGTIALSVACGDALDDVVLRSYCIGAAHMALSWVTSEAIAVDAGGVVQDLTIRSFGILRASDMPRVEVVIRRLGATSAGGGVPEGSQASITTPRNGSDAVFAAVAAAVWIRQGCPPAWPTNVPPSPVARTQEPA